MQAERVEVGQESCSLRLKELGSSPFFFFPLFFLFKTTTKINKTNQNSWGHLSSPRGGPAAAAWLCAGGTCPGAWCLLSSFESALGLAPRAAAPLATFLVKCAWIGL